MITNIIQYLRLKIIWPRLSDPRVPFIFFMTGFATFALNSPWFGRNWNEYWMTVLTCLIVDFSLREPHHNGSREFPISGWITGTGIFLVLESPVLWAYVAAAILGMTSKYFFRYQNKHIFNPNNFGVLIMILGFPDYATFNSGRWGGHIFWLFTFLALGTFVVWRAKRWAVALSYLSMFAALVQIKSWLGLGNLIFMYLPLISPNFYLFTFFMITDPKTSPKTIRGQLYFGALVACVDSLIRYFQNKNAPMISLFLMCIIFGVIIPALKERERLRTSNIS